MPVKIVTDEISNLDKESVKKYGIAIIPYLITSANGKEIRIAEDPNVYNPQEDRSNIEKFSTTGEYCDFLGKIRRKSEVPRTAAPHIERCRKTLEDVLKEEKGEICCILVSSNLNKVYENVQIAAEKLSKRFGRRIAVIDSRQGVGSEGLIVIEAAKLANQAKSLDEIVEYIENVKDKAFSVASLDNLEYLRRSGRISIHKGIFTQIADFFGIVPILWIEKGFVRPICNVRISGVKRRMIQEIERRIGNGESIKVAMSYSSNKQKTTIRELGDLIKEKFNVSAISYTQINKIIITNTGPNLYVAAIFRQGYGSINGSLLIEMFKESEEKLRRYRKIIDDINIFPVNDSDTGKNMLTPIAGVTSGLSDRDPVLKVIDKISGNASTRGGGCSGNALSQFLLGIRDYLRSHLKGNRDLDPASLVNALKKGAESAYASFREPMEGTILSVMRVVGQAAEKALREKGDFSYILEKSYFAGVEELLNPRIQEVKVLRDSDVADSGGLGFLIFFQAWLDTLGISLKKEIQELSRDLDKEIEAQLASLKYRVRYPGFCLECRIKGVVEKEDLTNRLQSLPNEIDYNALMIRYVNGDTCIHIHVSNKDLVDSVIHICKSYGHEVEKKAPTSLSQKKIDVFKNRALSLSKKLRKLPFLLMYWFAPLPRIFFIRSEIKKLKKYRDISEEKDSLELISKALGVKADEGKTAIFVCNRQGEVTYLSRSARETLGLREVAAGEKIRSYLPEKISGIIEERLITGIKEPFSFKEGSYILRLTPIYENRKNLGTLLELKKVEHK